MRQWCPVKCFSLPLSVCNSSWNITLNKHLDLKKKNKTNTPTLVVSKGCVFLPWRWYKGFNVGKQTHHAKWNLLYHCTLSFTRALIRGICTSGSDCPLSPSKLPHGRSCGSFLTHMTLWGIAWVYHEGSFNLATGDTQTWWYLATPYSRFKGAAWHRIKFTLLYPKCSFASSFWYSTDCWTKLV